MFYFFCYKKGNAYFLVDVSLFFNVIPITSSWSFWWRRLNKVFLVLTMRNWFMSIVLSSLSFLNTDDFYFFFKKIQLFGRKRKFKTEGYIHVPWFFKYPKKRRFHRRSTEWTSEVIPQPNYLTVLEKRITDMDKLDHGIVIAG